MATALPFQPNLLLSIDWQGETANVEKKTGALSIRGTIGFAPCREVATLSWMLPKDDARALVQTLKAGKMNSVYDYTCNIMGSVRIRATGSYGFREIQTDKGQLVQVTAGFERL
jgi:hypothetical protein